MNNKKNSSDGMKIVKATEHDFQTITQFYRNVIEHTGHIDTYAKWIYGLHPTDEMIRSYIRTGSMYYCEKCCSRVAKAGCCSQDNGSCDRIEPGNE